MSNITGPDALALLNQALGLANTARFCTARWLDAVTDRVQHAGGDADALEEHLEAARATMHDAVDELVDQKVRAGFERIPWRET